MGGYKEDGRIDSVDMLTKEMQHFVDCSNQLVKRPPEHYRWIRERIVWGWDFNALSNGYSREFGIVKSQAVWTIKSELGRLVSKITGYMLHSAASEIIGLYRLDDLYDQAVKKENWDLALAVQREINSMTSRYRARHKQRSMAAAEASPKKPGRPKLSEAEKVQRQVARMAAARGAKAGRKVAEKVATAEIMRTLETDEFAGLTDDEVLKKLEERRAARAVKYAPDQSGNQIPVLTEEAARAIVEASRSS